MKGKSHRREQIDMYPVGWRVSQLPDGSVYDADRCVYMSVMCLYFFIDAQCCSLIKSQRRPDVALQCSYLFTI